MLVSAAVTVPRVPLAEIPQDLAVRLGELGGRPINLYRALANQPEMLRAWIEMAWGIRNGAGTPRRLRELMILRIAQIYESEYEWTQHLVMARSAGVTDAEIGALREWRHSEAFTAPERAALAYAEAMLDGDIPGPVADALAEQFDAAERVELTLTAGFYTMVPRVLEALGVPLED